MSFFKLKILIFFMILFSLYIIIYLWSFIERKRLKINKFDIKNEKNNQKFKLVFITDFHNKKFDKRVLSKIFDLNPDYIVLGGDFINFSIIQSLKNKVEYKNALNFFLELKKEFDIRKNKKGNNLKDIFFGLGNHELRLKEHIVDNSYLNDVFDEFINCLKECEFKILDDCTFDLCDRLTISGLNLYNGYYGKKNKNTHIDEKLIDSKFNDIDLNKFNIMVFHKPDFCEDFIDYGFDLVLSGHNHGGLIVFPIIGPVFSPDFDLFPKYCIGLYKYKNGQVVVSSGFGEHFIKLRINNIPEICVLNIC